jgi:hypothetical protein
MTLPGKSESEVQAVLTDGHRLYIRVRRGIYHEVNRRGKRTGKTCSGFYPRPRWRPARLCKIDPAETLWCSRCGCYDQQYAETGIRSYCYEQSGRA